MKQFNQQEAVDEQAGEAFKREAFLAIGTYRLRVAEDFHDDLVRFCTVRRYSKQSDGLVYAASIGLRILRIIGAFNELNATFSNRG